jgi:hypothetical protein
MSSSLNEGAYQASKQKFTAMQARWAELRQRTDLHPNHRLDVELSYANQIRQYLRSMHLYETAHGLPLTECAFLAEARLHQATQAKPE